MAVCAHTKLSKPECHCLACIRELKATHMAGAASAGKRNA